MAFAASCEALLETEVDEEAGNIVPEDDFDFAAVQVMSDGIDNVDGEDEVENNGPDTLGRFTSEDRLPSPSHGRRPGRLKRYRWAFTSASFACAVVALAVLPVADLGFGPSDYKGEQPAQRCLGVVTTVAILWATEIVPSFIVAFSIPVFSVLGRVLCVPRRIRLLEESDTLLVPASYCNTTAPQPGHPMEASQAVVVATGAFFNPVVLLFLSGFTMSKVMDKYGLSSKVAMMLLSSGGPTRRLLLIMMFVSVLSSSFLSNVPASVLITVLLTQTFEGIEHTSWPKASLLGVAFACNIGGMSSPIASPQNIIAAIALTRVSSGDLSISFSSWLQVSVPFCVVAVLLCWAYIVTYYGKDLPPVIKPLKDSASEGRRDKENENADDSRMALLETASSDESETETQEVHQAKRETGQVKPSRFNFNDAIITVIVLATVVMWVAFDSLKHIFGNIGIVALLPIIALGAFGYLESSDFNSLSWDTLMLMGGGLSLGTAVESSGLLLTVGDGMAAFTSTSSPYVVLITFTALVMIVATFISSTVAAALLCPVIASVGVQIEHPKMLVILCAMMTSGAMGLPVSSFPNANAKAQTIDKVSILSTGDFVRLGLPASFIILVLVNSLGYGLTTLYGW